ncbi:ornithine cyclodeaminase family protein [Sphingopyxis panaciterrae]
MLDTAIERVARTAFGELPWIGREEFLRLVDMDEAIRVVADAMRTLSAGLVDAPERWAMPVADHGRMGLMPGAAPSISRFGIKVLSLFDASARGPLPSHQGVMLLFDLADGRPLCAVDGAALTVLRTAAASAVASRALARKDARSLAIIGCGEQARLHLAAMRAVFPIREVTLWNRSAAKADEFARAHLSGLAWRVCTTPAQAVDGADIVCTLTAAAEPILFGADFKPGQHVNLVGSSTIGPREVDESFVARARYIADSRQHALSQAAEFVHAVGMGIVSQDHLAGEIGDILSGAIPGRLAPDDITVYKSLGHIVQDLAVADAAHRKWQSGQRSERVRER